MSPDHPTSEQSFIDRMSSVLLEKLSKPVASFSELACTMNGAWPPEMLAVLKTLTQSGRVSQARFDALMSSQSTLSLKSDLDQIRNEEFSFPEPHPLNYDWRFSARTVDALVAKIGASAGPVALLGVPSLYRPLLAAGHEVKLFDMNADLCSGMSSDEVTNFVCVDLQDELPIGAQFSIAVADPPWYLEYYVSFLQRLQRLLSPGGRAYISVLPTMTRPSANADQQEIVSEAKALGFDLTEIFPSSLVYDTPPFEAAALLGEGLTLPHWRRADLYTFTRNHDVKKSAMGLSVPAAITEVRWKTFRFGACSVAVRAVATTSLDFTFAPSSEKGGSILHSVSRRSQARRHANIWSSKNHVFEATRTDCLIALFSQYSRERDRQKSLSSVQTDFGLSGASVSELNRLLDALEGCFA